MEVKGEGKKRKTADARTRGVSIFCKLMKHF